MASTDSVSFYLNGKAVTIEKPPPDLLLIDYLRGPEVALAGPKKPCGEGGCGGCTVILSSWNEAQQRPEHRAINACLRPVCALSGLVVTTVEGTGAVRKPDPEFLLHTLTASRTAAPLDTQYSPVLQQAAAAAATKRAAVLAAVQVAIDAQPAGPDRAAAGTAAVRGVTDEQPAEADTTAGTGAVQDASDARTTDANRAAALLAAEHDAIDARTAGPGRAAAVQLDDGAAWAGEAGGAAWAAEYPSEETHAGMNPVAYRLALNNGSQCGYCSVGFVMNMSEFIANHPQATKKEIEEAFDGNLCRCTGYRAILTGMKTFASDWTAEDEAGADEVPGGRQRRGAAAGRRGDPVSAGAAAPGRAGDECRCAADLAHADVAGRAGAADGPQPGRDVPARPRQHVVWRLQGRVPRDKAVYRHPADPRAACAGRCERAGAGRRGGYELRRPHRLAGGADADAADKHAGGARLYGTAHGGADRAQRCVAGRQHDARPETYRGGHAVRRSRRTCLPPWWRSTPRLPISCRRATACSRSRRRPASWWRRCGGTQRWPTAS